MDTGRTEKLSLALSVLFHAVVFAVLALGLGGASAGPVYKHMIVELFESPGGAQAPPAGPRAEAAQPKRAAVSEVQEQQIRTSAVKAVKTEAPKAEEFQHKDELLRQEDQLASSETVKEMSQEMTGAAVEGAQTSPDGQVLSMSNPGDGAMTSGYVRVSMSSGDGDPAGEGGKDVGVREVRIGEIRSAIQSAVVYPPMARRRGLEGTVLASFFVDERGAPHNVQVVQSSGYSIFDREVVRVIHAASPYPAVDIAVEVPVTFRLSSLSLR